MAAVQGLEGVTILAVARASGVSPGLVIHHFGSKRELILGLLDWLLESTVLPEQAREGEGFDTMLSTDHSFHDHVRAEFERFSHDPARARVLIDFWSASLRDPVVNDRLQAEFARYREQLRPIASALMTTSPERFTALPLDGVVSAIAALVKGSALQSMIDPQGFAASGATDALVALVCGAHVPSAGAARAE